MAGMSKRMADFAQGVLPVNPIEGEHVRWPVEERLTHYNCPGVSVCVIENGDIADAAGFGVITPNGRAVDADTIFAGASISKPVTAILALQLVEQGKLSLDAPVNNYLRTWKLPENAFTREIAVTLRHLLSHRAGTTVHGFGAFPRDKQAPTLYDVLNGAPPSLTPAVVVDKLPGTSVRYSGGGTQLVQLLLEEMTGLNFADLAAQKVFEPLGMRRTTFRQPLPPELEPYAAIGHHADGRQVNGRFTFTPQLAAGGIYTTGPDYARFMIECRNAWLGKHNILIGQVTARDMMSGQGGGQFGLGWEIFGRGAATRFAHGGSNEGYQCNTLCNLEMGWGGVVLTNSLSGIILYYELLNGLAGAYDWQGYMRPPRKVRTLGPQEQAQYVGRYAIVSGLEAPYLDVWIQDGQLYSRVEGLILPAKPVFMDVNGRFFTQQTPGEIKFIHDNTGKAVGLIAYAQGDIEVFRAQRSAESGA